VVRMSSGFKQAQLLYFPVSNHVAYSRAYAIVRLMGLLMVAGRYEENLKGSVGDAPIRIEPAERFNRRL
jgi:hypothetical protein